MSRVVLAGNIVSQMSESFSWVVVVSQKYVCQRFRSNCLLDWWMARIVESHLADVGLLDLLSTSNEMFDSRAERVKPTRANTPQIFPAAQKLRFYGAFITMAPSMLNGV
jgi:hypothetical protein